MIKYLKFKIVLAMVAITFILILGFVEFFGNGGTFLLKLGIASFAFHLLLYYIFIKRPENNKVQNMKP